MLRITAVRPLTVRVPPLAGGGRIAWVRGIDRVARLRRTNVGRFGVPGARPRWRLRIAARRVAGREQRDGGKSEEFEPHGISFPWARPARTGQRPEYHVPSSHACPPPSQSSLHHASQPRTSKAYSCHTPLSYTPACAPVLSPPPLGSVKPDHRPSSPTHVAQPTQGPPHCAPDSPCTPSPPPIPASISCVLQHGTEKRKFALPIPPPAVC